VGCSAIEHLEFVFSSRWVVYGQVRKPAPLPGESRMENVRSRIRSTGQVAQDSRNAVGCAAVIRKIKLGVVGCGGRGAWIASLFREHGGYEMHAVADHFPEVAEAAGSALGVAPARRFSGLSGYHKLIESGVEAVALETPPCFFPEHVQAAVDAHLHVYMAKPIAVDVPGCLQG
jgi:hypothetical protein